MPRRNGTGPLGEGPRTGKGLGKCGSKRNGSPKNILDDIAQGIRRGNKQESNRTGKGQGLGQGTGRGNK